MSQFLGTLHPPVASPPNDRFPDFDDPTLARWNAAGSTAIVTGASSGIGMELSRQLARQGSRVIVVARRRDRLDQLSDDVGDAAGTITAVAGDITDESFREQILDVALSEAGRIDLLVNNAGIGGIGPFADASPQRLRRIMEVNFFAPVELTRIALPGLRQGRNPVICNIGSVLGHRAVPGKSEYCASKFAMHGWSDALRAELVDDCIQVTLVSPSTTASEFFDVAIETKPTNIQRKHAAMSPAQVAAITLRAIERRKDEVILSAGGKSLVYVDRLFPWLANRVLARFG